MAYRYTTFCPSAIGKEIIVTRGMKAQEVRKFYLGGGFDGNVHHQVPPEVMDFLEDMESTPDGKALGIDIKVGNSYLIVSEYKVEL